MRITWTVLDDGWSCGGDYGPHLCTPEENWYSNMPVRSVRQGSQVMKNIQNRTTRVTQKVHERRIVQARSISAARISCKLPLQTHLGALIRTDNDSVFIVCVGLTIAPTGNLKLKINKIEMY